MLVCITFIAKLIQRVRKARDTPVLIDRIERSAERVEPFSNRINFDNLRPELIRHGV